MKPELHKKTIDNVDSERMEEKRNQNFRKKQCLQAGMLVSVPLKEESKLRIDKRERKECI